VAEDLSHMGKGVGGVIGTAVLDSYSAVIDYPACTLYLRSPLRTVWPILEGKWTATKWQDEDKPRKLDAKTAPTFEFRGEKATLTDGDSVRTFAMLFSTDGDTHQVVMFDPKEQGKAEVMLEAGGLTKFGKGTMSTCFFIDRSKLTEPKSLPTEFAAPAGSGLSLIEWKAETPGKPRPDPLADLMKKDGYTAVPTTRNDMGHRLVAVTVGKKKFQWVVDTGCGVTGVDAATLRSFGGESLEGATMRAFGGTVTGTAERFRGLTVGGYDTRTAWSHTLAAGIDLTATNKLLVENKRTPFEGFLGDLDLRNGSAVIDLGTGTLYLRPFKQTLWPKLAGKWVGVAWEHDGVSGKYRPEDKQRVEFANGKMTFDVPGRKYEWGFHVLDEGTLFSKGDELTRFALFDPKANEIADDFAYQSGGLIRLKGDRLVMVTVRDLLKARELPNAYAAPKGSGFTLVEYERAK
jgi:hypothetical protein